MQNAQTLEMLRRGPVTQVEAVNWSPPVFRLGARIFDLREAGHEIVTERIEMRQPGTYRARYILVKEAR